MSENVGWGMDGVSSFSVWCVLLYVCTARPSDFVLDKDAATRGFVTHLDLKCCGENPTAFFVMAGDSFMGHDSSFSTCRVHHHIH